MAYHVLCIDDNEKFLFGLKVSLKTKYQISTAQKLQDALDIISKDPVDLVLLDVNLKGESGIQMIRKIKKIDPSVIVIMLSGYKDPNSIVKAMKHGAADYLCKPYPTEELIAVIEKNLSNKSVSEKSQALIEYYNENQPESKLIGKSASMLRMIEKAQKLKGHDSSVLIEGESGTGKEVLAKYIYSLEQNPKRPFIAVNCAAIPETLLESELFGHEKGAFTGAVKRKIGKFELANGGDIFLDEINSLKPDMQAKLLRVLQEKEFYRLGGIMPIKVNVRVIVASNSELSELVKTGTFREDLFYRLRVIAFKIPALRERKADLKELIDYYLYKFGGTTKRISPQVIQIFRVYDWPGNIRELKNLIESLVILSGEDEIDVTELPEWMRSLRIHHEEICGTFDQDNKLVEKQINDSLKDFVKKKEVEYIKYAIDAHDGNISKTANVLKVSRSTIYNALNR